jgi:hypothetical protein
VLLSDSRSGDRKSTATPLFLGLVRGKSLGQVSDNENMENAPRKYDVDSETRFTREKLQTAIPNRLQELYDVITCCKSKGTAEPWFADLVGKILLSVNRVCGDLLKTIDQEAVSAAAWNSRNLLELWVWLKYCATSQENARRFHEDALRDVQGLTDALSKLHALQGIPNEFEASVRMKIAEAARDKLGLDSLGSHYTRVSDAAKAIGLGNFFASSNTSLSKFAHPTAGLVLGIMHQSESHRSLQATLTTSGLFFAGQCVIALEEIVLPIAVV